MSKQCLFFKLNPTYRAAVGVWLARPLPILKSSIGKCVFNSFWVDATFKQVVLRDLLTIRMGLKGCIRPLTEERKRNITNSVISQVTTIYSALLLFIHHWYIVFWWNNWKNYPWYSLWRSTRTQILVWKTRKGGTKLLGGGLWTVHTSLGPPSSACQQSVCLHTYLYLLRLTWQPHEERNRALLQHWTTFNPPSYLRVILPFRHTEQ